MGHEVFFVDPPTHSYKKAAIRETVMGKNISVISSGFNNSLFLRYKFRPLYNLLVKQWIKNILSLLPAIDILWCFETNIIADLRIFNMKKIFHVVDPIDKRMIKTGEHADLLICVSDRILQQFETVKVPKRFVNHALSDAAISNAKKININNHETNKRIQAGYVGNLTRKIIDVVVIASIIESFPVIDFHFWGPGNMDSILGGESSQLIQKIKEKANVYFHPPVDSADLVPAINEMDLFLLAYKPVDNLHDSSNSHKLLEYWATGKIVVSTYIDQYRGEENEYLLQMSPEDKNELLPGIFTNVIKDLANWNSTELLTRRKNFALAQSYSKNAKEILEQLDTVNG